MGVSPGRPAEFVEWLRAEEGQWRAFYPDVDSGDLYPPRRLYGLYLEARLREAVQLATSSGVSAEVLFDEAVALLEDEEGATVITQQKRRIRASHVVLALGNPPATTFSELRGLQGYVHSPYADGAFDQVEPTAGVLVAGTRLSAIDAALLLKSRGHRGSVVMASRSGRLPKVQAAVRGDIESSILERRVRTLLVETEYGKVRLDDVARIFVEEIERLGHPAPPILESVRAPYSPTTSLYHDILEAQSGTIPNQDVVRSAAPLLEEIWRTLDWGDKDRFLRRNRSLWHVFRHPIPLVNAQAVYRLLRNGELEVKAGLKNVIPGEKGFHLEFEGEPDSMRVQYVVNATGSSLHLPKTLPGILGHLLRTGSAVRSSYGGVDVDFDGLQLIETSGERSEILFAIGALTVGTHFYSNSADRLVAHAQRVAAVIYNALRFQPLRPSVARPESAKPQERNDEVGGIVRRLRVVRKKMSSG